MAYISFQPKDHYNTKLYTGTGVSNAITGVGFSTDFTWIKNRTANDFHVLTDVCRGATKFLRSNGADVETTNAESLKTFDADGFTVGTANEVNTNTENFVSWNWKGGGTGVANTVGSIASTVSANTTSGFSVVKWTGTQATGTIGHGLGIVPKMIIVKSLANATSFQTYHASNGNASAVYLESDAAKTSSTGWNSTTPTSTVFSVGYVAGNGVNDAGDFVAYCFADVAGFSKINSYIGNGNIDGSFCYTGMKPAFLIIKSAGLEAWKMFDNRRSTASGMNVVNKFFSCNTNAAEVTSASLPREVDFLSNGFKIRGSNTEINASGIEFIYMAFAEEPLVSSNGIPCTAR